MRKTKIYYLCEPNGKYPRYVGKTVGKLKRRLDNHVYESKRNPNTYKNRWINKVLSEGLYPEIHLIEECNEDNWQEREKYWIKYYDNLTNATEGGETFSVVNNRKVCQYSLDGVFIREYESVFEAMDLNGFKKGTIDSALIRNPDRCYCKDFLWLYSTNKFKRYIHPFVNYKEKPVRITDLETKERKIFESLKEGLNYLGLKACGSISKSIKNGYPINNKFSIVYLS